MSFMINVINKLRQIPFVFFFFGFFSGHESLLGRHDTRSSFACHVYSIYNEDGICWAWPNKRKGRDTGPSLTTSHHAHGWEQWSYKPRRIFE